MTVWIQYKNWAEDRFEDVSHVERIGNDLRICHHATGRERMVPLTNRSMPVRRYRVLEGGDPLQDVKLLEDSE